MIIGIDPGKTGGICVLSDTGEVVELFAMPVIQDLADRIEKVGGGTQIYAFLEKAHAMPGQGVCSMFNYGDGFGQIQGILIALKIPYTLVHPRAWTKVMHSGAANFSTPKERSLVVARRLFPSMELKASDRCRKPHMGMVDALLIAEYGRRQLIGQSAQN